MRKRILQPTTRILAIDPGSSESAWILVELTADLPIIWEFAKEPNDDIVRRLRAHSFKGCDVGTETRPVIEMPKARGMPASNELFETCVWIGRFVEAWGAHLDRAFINRMDVKLHICGLARARDSNIRAALIDRWGGDKIARGTKAAPGPLYGIGADVWAALAIATTAANVPV